MSARDDAVREIYGRLLPLVSALKPFTPRWCERRRMLIEVYDCGTGMGVDLGPRPNDSKRPGREVE